MPAGGNSVSDRIDSMWSEPLTPYGRTLFGSTRVAHPYTLGDYQAYAGLDSEAFVPPTVAGGGTVAHNAALARIELAVTGASGDRAFLTTKRQHRYQAGREQHALMTVQHSSVGQANQVRRWGYFDANDGLFYELSGTTLRVVRRTSTSGSPVDNVVAQGSWSEDKCDGTGRSTLNLNLLNGSIYGVRFQYLGVGAVLFEVNGWAAHLMDLANGLPNVYMKCPHLPLSWEVLNTGASVGATMSVNCANVSSIGGEDPPEFTYGFTASNGTVLGSTEVAMFSIRLAPTFNTNQNRMAAFPRSLNVSSISNFASARLLLNATLSGATYAAAVPTGSGMQIDTAGSYSSGGVEVGFGFAQLSALGVGAAASCNVPLQDVFRKNGRSLKRWSSTAGDADVLTVMFRNEQAGTTAAQARLSWAEVR